MQDHLELCIDLNGDLGFPFSRRKTRNPKPCKSCQRLRRGVRAYPPIILYTIKPETYRSLDLVRWSGTEALYFLYQAQNCVLVYGGLQASFLLLSTLFDI